MVPNPPQEANPLELGRTRLALGTVQRQARHKRAARETLEAAGGRRASSASARVIWAESTRARSCGESAAELRQRRELSETELRIVELVVAGRRNREVAAELSLSPNTVAWNLSKIYRKLGVGSRTELAAHVAAAPRAVNPQVLAVVRGRERATGSSAMPTYLVERYLPGRDRAWLEAALARLPEEAARCGLPRLHLRPIRRIVLLPVRGRDRGARQRRQRSRGSPGRANRAGRGARRRTTRVLPAKEIDHEPQLWPDPRGRRRRRPRNRERSTIDGAQRKASRDEDVPGVHRRRRQPLHHRIVKHRRDPARHEGRLSTGAESRRIIQQ